MHFEPSSVEMFHFIFKSRHPISVQKEFILSPQRVGVNGIYHALTISWSHSATTFPELRPNLPNELSDDKLLKLLLPSPRLSDILVLGFAGAGSNSVLVSTLVLATASRVMVLRQKGQTGILEEELGLL